MKALFFRRLLVDVESLVPFALQRLHSLFAFAGRNKDLYCHHLLQSTYPNSKGSSLGRPHFQNITEPEGQRNDPRRGYFEPKVDLL
jgi:hypothetical protein